MPPCSHVRPELGTFEHRSVDVVTSGAEAGRTIPQSGGGATAEIFTGADGRAAEAALLSGLTNSHVASIDESPDVVIDPTACTAAHGSLTAGPLVVEVAPGSAADGAAGVAIGTLDRGRGAADIEAFFETSAIEPPDWFTLTAALGAAVGAPSTDLVRVKPGDYTVVCVRGATEDVELEGISSFSVR